LLTCCALLAPSLILGGYAVATRINLNPWYSVGQPIDELNGVIIYFNGGVNTTRGRNLSKDGYNLGIRFQCVEFVKRYYFERYDHRMPDPYGHAKDFFDVELSDGAWNQKRGMLQYVNGGRFKPEPDDLLVFGPWLFNQYGHVAIVSSVGNTSLEVAQQNPGPFGSSRELLELTHRDGKSFVDHPRVLGWLRLRGVCGKDLSEIWSKSLRLQVGPYLILKERVADKDSIDGFVWRLSVKCGQQESIVWDSVRDDPDWLNFAVFDLLGHGSKQLIIEEYTGAAHCCWQDAIYELGAEPKLIYEPEGQRGGFAIEDFNQDGRWELLQSQGNFESFDPCSHATTPCPTIVFEFVPELGTYRPSNGKFTAALLADLEPGLSEYNREKRRRGDTAQVDADDICEILRITVDLLYAGQAKRAWEFFARETPIESRDEIKKRILEQLKNDSDFKQMKLPLE